MALSEGGSKFEFRPLPGATLGKFSKATEELFQKWGLEGRMHFVTFTYNQHFQTYQKESFVKDFFQNADVNSTLQSVSSSGLSSPLCQASAIDGVNVEEVPCTLLNMDFFDRLITSQVVRESGSIRKCFDEPCGDFIVSDELRKILLLEDSDNYYIYSDEDREEFLFRVLIHLALGGPVNQYEDSVKPYLDTAKLLYKQLLSVAKEPKAQTISIISSVFKVHAKVKSQRVFPGQKYHEQSFCYLIVDNVKRHVKVWYHVWR